MSCGSSFGVMLESADNNSGSPGTYTEVAKVIMATLPAIAKTTFETKTLGQADKFITKCSSFINPGQMTFTVPYSNAVYTQLLTWTAEEDPRFWRFVMPKENPVSVSGALVNFAGLLTNVEMEFPEDATRMQLNCTVEVSGTITVTAEA